MPLKPKARGKHRAIIQTEVHPESLVLNERIRIRLGDNLAICQEIEDKAYKWLCVDPPYGLGKRLSEGGASGSLHHTPMATLYRGKEWDQLPTKEYWDHVFRISENQIVFGANYFLDYLPATRGFVCWDKNNEMPSMSQCELVWTSIDRPAKIYSKNSMDLDRFHPTQKPVDLYRYMYEYCKIKPGELIIDLGFGSGSCLIAANMMGLSMHGIERDPEYYNKFVKRFKTESQKQTIGGW